MKRILVAGLVACAAIANFAAESSNTQTAAATRMVKGPDGKMRPVIKADKAKVDAAVRRHFGDKIKHPGVQKGKVVYVNCQTAVDDSLIKSNAEHFATQVKIGVETVKGSFDLAAPKVQGEATLFIVDDPKLPMSLVAPEARWCMVNVAPLKCEKPQFFQARVRKALSRGFGFLAGAVASQFQGTLVEGITKPEDYDTRAAEGLPHDVMLRIPKYLAGYGIVPYELVFYRKACEEGWAPNPTNDVQKKIWDDVHALPTKPIKIKYDPKRDKE